MKVQRHDQTTVVGRPQPEPCQHYERVKSEIERDSQVCGPDADGNVWDCPLLVLVPLEDFDICGAGPLVCDSKQTDVVLCRAYDIECGLVQDECVRTNPRLVRIKLDECKGEGGADHPKHRRVPRRPSGGGPSTSP